MLFLLKQDLFFSYKHVLRFLLINKFGFFLNTNDIPFLKCLVIFFDVFNITDIDDVRAFNYFYFIRFFFGRTAFFSKTSFKFHLGVNYFSYRVFCSFFKNDGFFPLIFFVNDILSLSYSQFYIFKTYSWKGVNFYFKYTDMNIFIEKKTNLGFYNLKDPLKLKVIFDGNDLLIASILLLKTFKIPFNFS